MCSTTLSPPDAHACGAANAIEMADVDCQFGPEYVARFGHVMLPSQRRALEDIKVCCTKALGGRLYHCDDCHESFWSFHCCRNRACPKCHGR